MLKIIFLDIDGVLNDHGRMMNLYCGIQKDKVEHLNKIIDATDCKIVISSAWRYMILGGEMTTKGFEYMLLTHGLKCHNRIIACTLSDEDIPTRGLQISYRIEKLKSYIKEEFKYVVIDDLNEENGIKISEAGHPLVQTKGDVGLTEEHVNLVISLLNERD